LIRKIYLFFLIVGGLWFSLNASESQIWVDQKGSKIEARFVKLEEGNLTLETFGQELVIPLQSLSSQSQTLAKQLSDGKAPTVIRKVPFWRDMQGRIIQANFIRADAYSITLEMNGEHFTLPMEMLDKKSMHQAFIFSQHSKSKETIVKGSSPSPNSSKKSNQLPSHPTPSPINQKEDQLLTPKNSATQNLDANISLDLFKVQQWTSTGGKLLEAFFSDLVETSLKLKTKSGKEVTLELGKIDQRSQLLAKKLKDLKSKRDQEIAQSIAKRKKMKVPSLKDEDLHKIHDFENTEGNTVKATFVSADDHKVVITLSNTPNRLIPMNWEKFSSESQALLEALRRLKKSMISPAGKNRLASFSRGPFKGYNSVLRSEHYNVALSANGRSVMIWLKSTGTKQKPKAFTVNFQNSYNYRALKRDNKGEIERHANGTPVYRWPSRSRSIKQLDDFFEPSMSRENITLRGSLDNGAKFEYNMELNKKGLKFWSKLEEKKPPPPKTELDIAFTPTKLYFSVGVPGLIPDAKNATNQKVKEIVGDASVSLRPQSGTLRQFPYKEQWTITKKKFQGEKFSTLKSMIFAGFPYGKNKLTVINQSTSDMSIGYHYGYGVLFPFQGMTINYGGRAGKYSQEIPKSRALKIEIAEMK